MEATDAPDSDQSIEFWSLLHFTISKMYITHGDIKKNYVGPSVYWWGATAADHVCGCLCLVAAHVVSASPGLASVLVHHGA